MNPKDFSAPVKSQFDWNYARASLGYQKHLFHFFQKNTLKTDSGLITSYESEQEFYSLTNVREGEVPAEAWEEPFFFSIGLYIDKNEKIYTRSYKKLQDVMAQVGGIVKIFIIISGIIVNPFAKRKFLIEFLEKLL